MRSWVKACLALGLFVLCIAVALPFVGDIDDSERFSAVVHVNSDTSLGTGIVFNRRLIYTAGHCLWDGSRYRSNVRITYVGADHYTHTVSARYIFIRAGFPKAYKKYLPILERKTDVDLTSEEEAIQNKMTAEDFGVVIPDEDVVISQKVRTILDDDLPLRGALEELGNSASGWTPEQLARITSLLEERIFSKITATEGLAAGYGAYRCNKDQTKCRSDAHRRWGKVELEHDWIRDVGGGNQAFTLRTSKGGALEKIGKSPIMPGDSGGPLFVAHPSGKGWLLVGIESLANSEGGYQHSLLNDADFLRWILNSDEYKKAMRK